MKQTLIPAVALALLTASVGVGAHMPPAHEGAAQPGPGHQAMLSPEMRALQEEMQSKMAAAKTPEERQALMEQQQAQMSDKMPGMAGKPAMPMGQMGGMGQMSGMGMPMRRHQQMMQAQRPASGG